MPKPLWTDEELRRLVRLGYDHSVFEQDDLLPPDQEDVLMRALAHAAVHMRRNWHEWAGEAALDLVETSVNPRHLKLVPQG